MSFLDDAQAFLKSRTPVSDDENILHLDTTDEIDAFILTMRRLYENATETEIRRALNQVMDDLDRPFDKKIFLQKMRVKLED